MNNTVKIKIIKVKIYNKRIVTHDTKYPISNFRNCYETSENFYSPLFQDRILNQVHVRYLF